MRSIALHVNLEIAPELAPLDIFSIRANEAIFYPPEDKAIANCIGFLTLLSDCIETHGGRLRLSISIQGRTASLLHQAGAGPVAQWLNESGCVQFCGTTNDQISPDGVNVRTLAHQLDSGSGHLSKLLGRKVRPSSFGDASGLPTQPMLAQLEPRGYTSLLFQNNASRLDAAIIDETTRIQGIPVSINESAALSRLLSGQGIPGQVTQQLRNAADLRIPILSITPRNHDCADRMLPRWLHALFSDPLMRTLTVDEALLRLPSKPGDLSSWASPPHRTQLHQSARKQLLELASLPALQHSASSEKATAIQDWHKLLSENIHAPVEQSTAGRHITGIPAYDSYVRTSIAIAAIELRLRALGAINKRPEVIPSSHAAD